MDSRPDASRVGDDELHPSGSLGVAVALAGVAGFVDAHVYLHVGQVFVANMSGNIVSLGMAAGKRDGAGVVGPAVAISAFVAGMATAASLHNRTRKRGLPLRPHVAVALELVALVVLLGFAVGYPNTTQSAATLRALPIFLAGGFAMGLQTEVVRRVGGVPVTTTYESGVIARVGEESALLGDRSRSQEERRRRSRILLVLAVIVAAYTAGAAVAAALGQSVWLLLIPIAVLALVGLVMRWRRPV